LPERGHGAIERMDLVGSTMDRNPLSTYQTVADRDGMVQSGMEAGWRQGGLEAMEKLH
jgi:hypothetical protein